MKFGSARGSTTHQTLRGAVRGWLARGRAPVRLGPERATRLYVLTVAAAYASLPVLAAVGLPKEIALAAAVPAPVALWRITRTRAGDFQRPERWKSVTFWAVALLVGTAVVELVGITVLF